MERYPWPLRLALRAYPRPFRERYGREYAGFVMEERQRHPGIIARTAFWARTLGDAAAHGVRVRMNANSSEQKDRKNTGDRSWMETMMGMGKDLQLTLRSARRDPLYVFVTVATLALGIGATTAIYTVVDNVLLRPLPYDAPERLVSFSQPEATSVEETFSWPDFRDLREEAAPLAELAATHETTGILTGVGDARRLEGAAVSHNLFRVLNVEPLLGRGFAPEEDVFDGPNVVVLSWSLWQTDFGGRLDILGSAVTISDEAQTIVGVMPRGFTFPEVDTEFWRPLREDQLLVEAGLSREQRGLNYLEVIGRVRDELTPGLKEGLSSTYRRVQEAAAREEPRSLAIVTLQEARVGDLRDSLLVFLWASLLVLGIACANVANVSLSRALRRSREFAVRTALGANRVVLARQVLIENVALSFVGAVLGIVLARAVLASVAGLVPDQLVDSTGLSLDHRVLLFTGGVATLAGVAAGLIPAVRSASTDPGVTLGASSRGNSQGRSRRGLQTTLVTVQVALSIVLLIGAGLLLRSFQALSNQELGFRPEGVVVASVELPELGYESSESVVSFYSELFQEIEQIPGVTNATATYSLPFSGSYMRATVEVNGVTIDENDEDRRWARTVIVGDAYFDAMDVPILNGRAFNEQDRGTGPKVAVINQAMADWLWPGEDPLGRTFSHGSSISGSIESLEREYFAGEITVVGVAGNERREELSERQLPEFYRPHSQIPWRSLSLVVRTDGSSLDVVPQIRTVLRDLNASIPLERVRTLNQQVAEASDDARLRSLMAAVFGLIAALLTMVGIYGVTSFSVSQRYRELGVRLALGAERDQVLSLVLRGGLKTTLIGLAIGVPGAAATSTLVSSMLFGTDARDPLTYAAVMVLIVGTATIAAWIPARRATRIDPVEVLGAE